MKFALVGNQNCGKTTLFNALTGRNQHVGNFPGLTVEKKYGLVKGTRDTLVVDLPGIYSLTPYSSEEVVTRNFIMDEKPDAVINIVDATHLDRNLYLTLQLMELQVPMVLALNMMDEVESNHTVIDIEQLQKALGIDVVSISAGKNQGIAALVEKAMQAKGKQATPYWQLEEGEMLKTIEAVKCIIQENAQKAQLPMAFAAIRLIEKDTLVIQQLALSEAQKALLTPITSQLSQQLHTDLEAAAVDMRYAFIEKLCKSAVRHMGENKNQLRSLSLDKILTHRIWGLPIFFFMMFVIFTVTFGPVGSFLSDALGLGIEALTNLANNFLIANNISVWMHSLIIDGIFTGIGSVLSFLPTIILLFFFLSVLEDTGYMARVAFVMDRLLRKIGLSGRSFVPMLIGFGCSVPAMMATRTLSGRRDRKMTLLLVPFMSCSAKLPIYAVFTAAFFARQQALVMMALYVLGMGVGILYGLLMKKTLFKGDSAPFLMELPPYRLPSSKTIILHLWEKAKDFMIKAFTLIFLATLMIWFLQSFTVQLVWTQDSGQSILALIGQFLAPLFAPLGFGDWRAATALLSGLSAKEAVVSTLSILMGAADADSLTGLLAQIFNPLSAFSFLCFTLLYMPCIAAMAALRRESGSSLFALGAMVVQTLIAWLITFMIYQTALLFVG